MISYEEALNKVMKNIKPLNSEELDISEAIFRYLFNDIYSPSDMPRFDNSSMDGYAIKSSDTIGANKRSPVVLRVVGVVKTGVKNNKMIKSGEALRISTGGRIPEGADAVVMKEEVKENSDGIIVFREIEKGENIRKRGEDFRKNERVLKSHGEISPQTIGLLASLGIKKVKVFRRPEISFISTGSELVDIGKRVNEFKIYNSNYYMINALLGRYGLGIKSHQIVGDSLKKITYALWKAVNLSDVILVSGGISVGNVDYVKEALMNLGVEEVFWGVRIRPGKPLFFGKMKEKVVFGLPGNPVSSFVCSVLFVIPALRKMMGSLQVFNNEVEASLIRRFEKKGERRGFILGSYRVANGHYEVSPLDKQGSHFIGSLAKSNCLILTDYKPKVYNKSEKVRIILL